MQIKQVLDVAASALKSLADDAKRARERSSQAEKDRIELALNERGFVENVRSGWIHDGRLDCVAANGVMGELGMGIEKSEEYSWVSRFSQDGWVRHWNADSSPSAKYTDPRVSSEPYRLRS